MNTNQATIPLRKRFLLLSMILFTCSVQSTVFAAGKLKSSNKTAFFEDDKKSKKEKGRSAKSIASVKVIPDIIRRTMHVTVKADKEKQLDFYVFDMDGKMVQSYKVKGGERVTIENLERGIYTYHVFCEDESIATGQLQFR
jgi:hypothetical protein